MAKKKAKKKSRKRYSGRRFKIVLLLLTSATAVVFAMAVALTYHTLRFTALIDARLAGERGTDATWVDARPFELRRGQRLSADELEQTFNQLGYKREPSLDGSPGTFTVDGDQLQVQRRGRFRVPVEVSFADKWVGTITDLNSGGRLERVVFEPVPVTTLFGQDRAKQRWMPLSEIPEQVVGAVLATEDQRFFSHTGLDPIGIARALFRDLTQGELAQGGSTITQQLVKNYFLTPERTLRRKLLEIYLAVILENRTSKNDILELYLNDVYLGQRGSFAINGIGQASRVFFGKDVQNAELHEAALIAAVIRSPNGLSPFHNPDQARARRNVVLEQMAAAGYVEPTTAKAASQKPLGLQPGTIDVGEAPYFIDALRGSLLSNYDVGYLQTAGLRVASTMDRYLQTAAQRAVVEGLDEVRDKLGRAGSEVPQAALVALDPSNGDVVALVGARSYGESQFNRAIDAHRQPGSAFKPFVYLAAFEKTHRLRGRDPGQYLTPATIVVDERTTFQQGGRPWTPQNYSRRFEGPVSYRRALALSLNVATARVGERVGFGEVVTLWQAMGMPSRLEPYPSLVLGAFEVTPLELATAYAVLANGGNRVEPRFFTSIMDGEGRELMSNPVRRHSVTEPESAYLVTEMLQSVISFGTAREIRARGFTAQAAGKTGTTNDTRDAWFVGYTPELLAAVWVGYDDNRPLGLSGSQAALPIWTRFMKAAVSGREKETFQPPNGVRFVQIDPASGKLAKESCPKPQREAFLRGTEPHELCPIHH